MRPLYRNIPPKIFPVNLGSIPEPNLFNLNNGVPVYIIEAGSEEIMKIEFIFKAGQINEDLPLSASTTNMMLMEGTQKYNATKINKLIDYYGAFLNPIVEKDRAGVIVYFLTRHIEKILELCLEILFRPVFPENELEMLLKKRLQWHKINREKVQNLAMDQFLESVFGSDHPYGKQVHIPDFKKITTPLLRKFHSRFYSPDKMAIIVSGKIHNDTKNLLNKYFGSISPGMPDVVETRVAFNGEERKKVYVEKKQAIQSAIRIGSVTITKRHADYPGLMVLDTILGGYFGSRLMKNIREEKGYTYGINSVVSSFELSGYKVISTEVGKKHTEKTIEEIYKEIRLLQTRPVGTEELNVVKNYMSGEMVRMFDGPFAIAESFKAVWEIGLDNSYYYKLAEKIKKIEPDEIIELAKTYFNIVDLYEVIAG